MYKKVFIVMLIKLINRKSLCFISNKLSANFRFKGLKIPISTTRNLQLKSQVPSHLPQVTTQTLDKHDITQNTPNLPDITKQICDKYEQIRTDKVELLEVDNGVLKKNLCLKTYCNLVKYAKELNTVFDKSTFIGCTLLEQEKNKNDSFDYVDGSQMGVDKCILHFRGYERGELLCLCFSPKFFPLIPTPSVPYRSFTERRLEYFEHVLSGLTGLRLSKIHTPYHFRNVISMDFCDAVDPDKVIYKLIVLSDRTNKLLLVDNSDETVLGSSETLIDPKDNPAGDNGEVGRIFSLPVINKKTPRVDENFEEFRLNFKNLNNMSIIKAMLSVYEGIDYTFLTSLCSKLSIDPSTLFYRIPDLNLFHSEFINKIRQTIDNSGSYNDMIGMIYNIYGGTSPVYRLNRLLEKTTKLSVEFKEKLEKIAKQCADDENYEKLSMVNEKIENITDYQNAINDIKLTNDVKKLPNLEEFHEQLLMINDLKSYKILKKKKKVQKVKVLKVTKKTKKVGKILHVPVNDRDDSPMMIVGKNAKQNEVVTHDMREKGDLWLHTKDCPGSHVILRNFRNDDHSIQIAADVASFFSKYKQFENVQVIVADIEKVKKEKNSQIGAVTVQEFKTIVGSPKRGDQFIQQHKLKSA
uniref:NFACT RNA-binding domain-containing protein n=1 Tax=Theileria annulata TaxID=5874 RepID=A0A3B0MHC7_THEAN